MFAVFVFWVQGFVRPLLQQLGPGRDAQSDFADQAVTALQWLSLFVVCVALVLGAIERRSIPIDARWILIALWVAMVPLHGGIALPVQAVFPLFVLAWMLLEPDDRLFFRIFAWIGVATAVVSLGYAALSDQAFMPQGWHAEKAIIGANILVGPFHHSNTLGMVMLLSIPFVVTQFSRWWRYVALILVWVALLWSAARISIAAAAVVTILSLAILWLRPTVAKWIVAAAAVGSAAAALVVPFVVQDRAFLTNRGSIWDGVIEHVASHPLFGFGPRVFGLPELQQLIGFNIGSGHNIFIGTLAIAGYTGVALLIAALAVSIVRSFRRFPLEPVLLLFVVAFTLFGIGEDQLPILDLRPAAYVITPMLVILLAPFLRQTVSQKPESGAAHSALVS